MASERDFELLDEYLSNRLKGNEKVDFELRLRQDPDLQNELKFQQQIAEGIRKARVAELKGMLNRIPVPASGVHTNLIRWTSLGMVAVIGVGLYFYLKSPVEPKVIQQETEQTATAPAEIVPVIPVDSVAAEPGLQAEKESKSTLPATKSVPEKQAPKPGAKDPRKVEVFDPTSEPETEENTGAPAISAPATEVVSTPSRSVVIDNTNRKYRFHYLLEGDDLTLYGDFEDNLYTIMEFKSDDKQTVIFMFYKNNYYLLNQNPGTVNRLVPVNDPVLLKRLREQRAQN